MAITREYTYTVTFTGKFPLDQLRYEWARARTSADSATIERSLADPEYAHHQAHVVQLVALNKPSGRWGSFRCIVGEVSSQKVA